MAMKSRTMRKLSIVDFVLGTQIHLLYTNFDVEREIALTGTLVLTRILGGCRYLGLACCYRCLGFAEPGALIMPVPIEICKELSGALTN
jgi:hypothetical protein